MIAVKTIYGFISLFYLMKNVGKRSSLQHYPFLISVIIRT